MAPLLFWVIHHEGQIASRRRDRLWRETGLERALIDRGHRVIRWRSAFDHQSKTFTRGRRAETVEINQSEVILECSPYRRNIGLMRIRNHAHLAFEFSRLAKVQAKPDLIHVSMPTTALARAAVVFANKNSIPVVVDVRDLWPDVFVDLLPNSVPLLQKSSLAILRQCSLQLKRALRGATGITSLTEPYLEWALNLADRSATSRDGVFPMCCPSPGELSTEIQAQVARLMNVSEKDIVAVFAGTLGYQFDFETLLSAASRLQHRIPHLKIVIAGSGPRENELRSKATGISNVTFTGRLDYEELLAVLGRSDIGLAVYRAVPNFLKNVPNKFPEYLAHGLAILCGLEGEMGKLTREFECGVIYRPGDPEDCAMKLERLCNNEIRSSMRQAAIRLHRTLFDASEVLSKHASHLEKIAVQHLKRIHPERM